MEISKEEMNTPLSKGGGSFEDLELLPDREWLKARIINAEYVVDQFKGQINYLKDKETGEPLLDKNGNPLPRKVFNITYELKDYKLPNGNPRKCWLKLGASFSENAHLPMYLHLLEIEFISEPTPLQVTSRLKGLDVKIQLANKVSQKTQKMYQNVVWDAIKLESNPDFMAKKIEDIDPDEIAWDD